MALISFSQHGNSCEITNGAITTGTANFADTTDTPFFSGGVGLILDVMGAGAASGVLQSSIKTFTDSGHVVLNNNAGTTVSGARWMIGSAHASAASAVYTITVPGAVAAGDLLALGINTDVTRTISSITDSSGNAWTNTVPSGTNGSANADYYQQGWVCTGAKAASAGTLIITITFSGTPAANNTSIVLVEFAASMPGVWSINAFASSSGSSTAVTSGNLTTTNPNCVLWGWTGVQNTVTAAEAGFTSLPSQQQNNAGGLNKDAFADISQYQIVSGTQSNVACTATQSPTGAYIASFYAFAFTPNPGVLPVQQRAPGFPTRAPLPGIATLGRGILNSTSPTGVSRTMQVAMLGQATEVAPLAAARPLTDAIAGQATFADTLSVSRTLTDTFSGHATMADAASVTRAMNEAISGLAALGFALYRLPASAAFPVQQRAPGFPIQAPLPGIVQLGRGILVPTTAAGIARAMQLAVLGQATLAESLAVSRALSDAFHGTGTVADPLSVARPLTNAVHGSASMGDALSVARPLTAGIAGQASLGETLSVARAFADSFSGHATLTDNAAVARAFADAIGAHAVLSDALSVARPLAVILDGQGNLSLAMLVYVPGTPGIRTNVRPAGVPMVMPLPGIVRLGTGILLPASPGIARTLALAVVGIASESDSMGVARSLTESIRGSAALTDALSAQRALANAMGGQASLTDALAVKRALTDAIHGSSTLSLTEVVARAMTLAAGGHAVLLFNNSAVPLSVHIAGSATLIDAMSVARALFDAIGGAAAMGLSAATVRSFNIHVTAEGQLVVTLQVGVAGQPYPTSISVAILPSSSSFGGTSTN